MVEGLQQVLLFGFKYVAIFDADFEPPRRVHVGCQGALGCFGMGYTGVLWDGVHWGAMGWGALGCHCQVRAYVGGLAGGWSTGKQACERVCTGRRRRVCTHMGHA